jgi:hypothetical protein
MRLHAALAVSLAFILLASSACDQFKQDPAKQFPTEVKATFLLVEEDLRTEGKVRDDYIQRLRTTYNKFKGEFGSTQSMFMLDMTIKTLERWRDSNWSSSYQGVYRQNRTQLDTFLSSEFPSGN